jgi:hypothetical protein
MVIGSPCPILVEGLIRGLRWGIGRKGAEAPSSLHIWMFISSILNRVTSGWRDGNGMYIHKYGGSRSPFGGQLTSGKFHAQGDAKWIVIRGQLSGHNDTPCRRPTSSRPPPGHTCWFQLLLISSNIF